MIEIKATKYNEGKTKAQIIKEVAELCKMTQADVRDVLNAFTDVCMKEMIVTGVLAWPGLPTVTRIEQKEILRYQKDLDKTLLYPKAVQLRARVPIQVKKLHREMFRNQNNQINGVSVEDWWKPYFYCDGDWRELKKAKK